MMLPQIHTLADVDHVTNYCAEQCFSQPNYLRRDEAALFAIFHVAKIIEQLQVDGIKRAPNGMRERALKLGFPKLYLQRVSGFDRFLSR